MKSEDVTRRSFLRGSGALFGGSLLRAGVPALTALSQAACSARDEGAAFQTLTDAEAREVAAIAARIIPTTDTPGATEAGVVYFFDNVLGSLWAHRLEEGRQGLAAFQAGIADAYPGAERFSDLDEADQDEYLGTQEQTPFFQGARLLTIFGMFSMQKYGGNRDYVGYELLGMGGPPRAHTYPFGYYDAEYAAAQEGQQDGE